MNLRSIARLAATVGLLTLGQQASATIITYDVSNVTGSIWRYDYSVTNDALATSLGEFSLYFQLGQYENLLALTAPSGWDGLIAQPDPLLPDNGFIDLLAQDGGIGIGQTLAGFSVQFDWLGLGAPGSQPFDVIDPANFTFVDSGVTQRAVVTPPIGGISVPEPSVFALLTLALPLAATVFLRRRRATCSAIWLALAPAPRGRAVPVSSR